MDIKDPSNVTVDVEKVAEYPERWVIVYRENGDEIERSSQFFKESYAHNRRREREGILWAYNNQ